MPCSFGDHHIFSTTPSPALFHSLLLFLVALLCLTVSVHRSPRLRHMFLDLNLSPLLLLQNYKQLLIKSGAPEKARSSIHNGDSKPPVLFSCCSDWNFEHEHQEYHCFKTSHVTVCRTLTSNFTNGEHLTSFFKFRFLLLWTAHVANCVQRELLEDEYSSERKRKKFGNFFTETLKNEGMSQKSWLWLVSFFLCSCVP